MMQTRNLRTSYFIIWMFPAPSKPFLQTELGLEDFPCAYSTRPDQMRQISPGAGLTLQCSIRRVCDWPQNTLLQGVTLHKQQEDGLLLESLLTAASCFWFCFSLKDTDLSLFADFWIPPSTSGRGRSARKNKDDYNDFSRRSSFSTFFPLPEMAVTLEVKQHLCFFSYVSVEDWADMKGWKGQLLFYLCWSKSKFYSQFKHS